MNDWNDPDSLHYVRANVLIRYQTLKGVLSTEDRLDWLDWFEGALAEEIQYAADKGKS